MAETTEIRCDACGKDLTYRSNCEDWRLVLANQAKTPWYVGEGLLSGAMTVMAISAPIERTAHFCGRACLKAWITL